MGDAGESIEGYLEMSRDVAREREAEEWSEGLVRDLALESLRAGFLNSQKYF